MPSFDGLLRRLAQKTASKPRLIRAMVELTYGCNLRCVHCYNPTHEARNELSTEQVFRVLDGLEAHGRHHLGGFSCGLASRDDVIQDFWSATVGLHHHGALDDITIGDHP